MKYHKSDVIGVLLGHKVDSKRIEITDAVPLFHHKIMSGTLEIAFDMIESTLVNETTKIIGLYEAPIVGVDGMDLPSQLGKAILSQIKSNGQFNEPCIISLVAVHKRDPKDQDSTYMKLEVELHAMGQ
jgi:Uncharacterised protein family (UPF0172)